MSHSGEQSDLEQIERRSRLEPIDRSQPPYPWQRATQLGACQLYWMPVSEFPVPFRQRQWLLQFYSRFSEQIATKHDAKAQTFLQMKALHPHLRDNFIKTAPEFSPIIGLSRNPFVPLPTIPDERYAEALQKGTIKYDHKALQPDYCYWFIHSEEQRQRELFFGQGGVTTLYIKPDPENVPPEIRIPPRAYKNPALRPLLEQNKEKLQRVTNGAFALKSPFLKNSKEIFGADLKEDPQYPGLLFIIPLLHTQLFFQATEEDIRKWFSLFDFYINESPKDKGILLATQYDIERDLTELVLKMKEDGLVYTE
jgi:hypothetical protein